MNKSFEKILELIEQNTLKNRDSISFLMEVRTVKGKIQ